MANLRQRALFKQLVRLNPITTNLRPRFRLGVSTFNFTTLTDRETSLKYGFSGGITTQLQLFQKLALTAEFHYVRQRYILESEPNDPINANDFPQIKAFEEPVKSIDVTNQYLHLPVGLKWDLRRPGSTKTWYINPGVAWQLYLPQQFDYKLNDDSNHPLTNEQYFAYFGSAFLNIGISSSFHPNLHWQLGVLAEYGLVEYGLNNRQTINLGLYGAILFGK